MQHFPHYVSNLWNLESDTPLKGVVQDKAPLLSVCLALNWNGTQLQYQAQPVDWSGSTSQNAFLQLLYWWSSFSALCRPGWPLLCPVPTAFNYYGRVHLLDFSAIAKTEQTLKLRNKTLDKYNPIIVVCSVFHQLISLVQGSGYQYELHNF